MPFRRPCAVGLRSVQLPDPGPIQLDGHGFPGDSKLARHFVHRCHTPVNQFLDLGPRHQNVAGVAVGRPLSMVGQTATVQSIRGDPVANQMLVEHKVSNFMSDGEPLMLHPSMRMRSGWPSPAAHAALDPRL